MASKNVPQLRFDGFDGEWSMTPLNNFVNRVTRKNSNLESDLTMTISAHHGLISQMEFFNKRIASTDLSGYYLMKNGEFTYNKSYSSEYPWGAVKRLDRYEQGVVSNLYIVFSHHDIDSDYLVSYYNTSKWHREVAIRAKEGARNHGLLNISADEFFSTPIAVPRSDKEQKQIGQLIAEIDKKIQGQRDLCDKLRKLKAALLDKLFPKNGLSVPELRLEGFSEPWQKVRLSEVFTTISQKGFPHLPILSASQELGMILRSENGIDMTYGTQNVAGYKRVQPGQLVIHLRSFQGGFAHSSIEGITSPAYTILKFIEPASHNDIYWKYVLVSDAFIKMLESVTYGIRDGKSIKFEDVARLSFSIPSYKEQCAIAEVLRQHQNLIELNNNKLVHLQRLKSAMLDKLFV